MHQVKQGSARGSLLLLLGAIIWGSAFVAQSMGMDHIKPFTFQFIRSLLGCLTLLPYLILNHQKKKRQGQEEANSKAFSRKALYQGGILCGLVLFVANNLQQFGLLTATPGKAGFLTTLYIIVVPLYGLLLGQKVRPLMLLCVALAAVGLYLLSVTAELSIAPGDLLLIGCALVYAVQILLVDHYGVRTDGVALCALQFLVCGLLSGVCTFLFEQPRMHSILAAWGSLLYAGVLSSGVAYTLQILGQRTTPPAVASLLMSLEAVFAVLAGMLVLHQIPSQREIAGSALMFAAILIAQKAQGPRMQEIPAGDGNPGLKP